MADWEVLQEFEVSVDEIAGQVAYCSLLDMTKPNPMELAELSFEVLRKHKIDPTKLYPWSVFYWVIAREVDQFGTVRNRSVMRLPESQPLTAEEVAKIRVTAKRMFEMFSDLQDVQA